MTKLQAHPKNLLTGLTVVLALITSGCEQQESEKAPVVRPVLAMKVGDVTAIGGRVFHGRARATQEANLAFDVSGTLIERPVKVGDSVTKGQVLARLDPRDYSSSLKAAQAELTKAKANFKRAKELIEKGYISKVEYDRMQAAASVAAANVETTRKALGDATLKAPFTGRISELFVENFQAVQAKQQITRLVDTSRIEMVIDIPETLISLVPLVKSVRVRFDAFPDQEIPAGVKEIGAEASETTRTYPVTLVMDQPQGFTILPGMAGEARGDPADIPKETLLKGFQVPLSAVFSPEESDKSFDWVVDEQAGTVSRREVVTGQLKSTGLFIEKGLSSGEWIATAGVHQLREGQSVRLLPAQGD